ncbi:uncharacterized protein E0L32_001159 [Thyridium curvatum]|uniref:Uncharacterized protein n=1 Tax=Thyridium curvatum TaxID=1093900 RepID=A0A507B2P5_9PEZI|nr:uncharacterized protein E0L32_001159 [Thyridium curvatum]TPX11341.1 hypothetical protein E0L32_001159 [Thyridium curvatum]
MVKFSMQTALARSTLVANILRPYKTQGASHKPNARIMNQMKQIFGKDDVDTAGTLLGIFERIASFRYKDLDARGEAWKGDRDFLDLEIWCNSDYVIELEYGESNVLYHDTVQDMPVENWRTLVKMKHQHDPDLEAVTSPAHHKDPKKQWPVKSPEVITFNPGYIKEVTDKNSIFNADRIRKAEINDLRDRINSHFRRTKKGWTNVDLLETLELVLHHELTHLKHTADTIDVDSPNSYGWLDVLRLKSIKNADNLAYFALVVDLIQNHHYDVDAKGKLVRFT